MSVLVLAEKPSVARDVASVLGARRRAQGYLEGGGYRVTWAVGHLVALAQPHEMRPEWRSWRPSLLPMLPASWPLVVRASVEDQFRVVEALLTDEATESIVVATDAGREGELIFRYIYEKAGCTKPFSRLWISSLTDDAIKRGFERLQDGRAYDGLAAAARARSRADWLVGMNLSRAYSVAHDDKLSVGRVQTPTLAMLVEREHAIREFVPEAYLEVEARFRTAAGDYRGTYHRVEPNASGKSKRRRPMRREQARLPADGVEAEALVARAREGEAAVARVDRTVRAIPPPLLYDLAELQRDAHRLYGLTAQRTLEVAQELYERHKVLSYPRTDSRHLSQEVAATLPAVLSTIEPRYAGATVEGAEAGLSSRFVDDAKVTDHHAIIPTPTRPRLVDGTDEAKLYDLVCRRLLAAYHEDHLEGVTTVETCITTPSSSTLAGGVEVVDTYLTRGLSVEREGWKVLEPPGRRQGAAGEPRVPGGLAEGMVAAVEDARALDKKTRPPNPYSDATLLTAMETCGRAVDAKELSAVMRDSGIGTAATRAAIIETLIARGYVERSSKTLRATQKGERLIDVVHPHVKSPAMTGEWELALRKMERAEYDFDTFMRGIESYVGEVVGSTVTATPTPRMPGERMPAMHGTGVADHEPRRGGGQPGGGQPGGGQPGAANSVPATSTRPVLARSAQPVPPSELGALLRTRFGFNGFRPHQEAICRVVTEGQSALVVMPTGAGKSLCYQLPGVARAGTTLVISPLIALIEDQVEKLRSSGFVAARIHSGMDRLESRQVCVDYLAGRLDFLFIAPERLSVPGFPAMLARREPSLIAVDEAHCISHWGHDFRPDYRMLSERLAPLRSVPIVALTATATPLVQRDILGQLGIENGREFIYGFRRQNIAVEVVEAPSADRPSYCEAVLARDERLPAIVYAPTRKECEALAATLGGRFRAAAYHAGLPAEARARVQEAFLRDQLDVIVATIAFGMGVDKPNVRTVIHTSLPGSIEGYYQEIGRAGRDGAQSRAILLYGFGDLRTHRFFFERDYPEVERVARLFRLLDERPTPRAVLERKLGEEPEMVERMLEKLWMQGGALVDPEETVRRGSSAWEAAYRDQRRHREAQLEHVVRFVETVRCRMIDLVEHFGDREDSGEPCMICDACHPTGAIAARSRPLDDEERSVASRLSAALAVEDGQAVGRLHREVSGGVLSRPVFQRLLQGLGRAGVVRVSEESFEKDGRSVRYQRVWLGANEESARREALATARVPEGPPSSKRASSKKPTGGARSSRKVAVEKRPRAAKKPAARSAQPGLTPPEGLEEAPAAVVEALRVWRLETARTQGVPAFRVLTDRQLFALASASPADSGGLLEVQGFGAAKVKKYGDAVLRVLRQDGS